MKKVWEVGRWWLLANVMENKKRLRRWATGHNAMQVEVEKDVWYVRKIITGEGRRENDSSGGIDQRDNGKTVVELAKMMVMVVAAVQDVEKAKKSFFFRLVATREAARDWESKARASYLDLFFAGSK